MHTRTTTMRQQYTIGANIFDPKDRSSAIASIKMQDTKAEGTVTYEVVATGVSPHDDSPN